MKSNTARHTDSGIRALPTPKAARVSRPRATRTPGVVDQVRTAFRRENRLAACVGLALGGLVPTFGFTVAHQAHRMHAAATLSPVQLGLALTFVAAALLFSAPTVYGWARTALGSAPKALGFVVLVEAAMVSAETLGLAWIGWVALAYLVAINAVATATRLAGVRQ